MTTRTTSQTRPTRADAANHLWTGAGLTAFAAVLFPGSTPYSTRTRRSGSSTKKQRCWSL